MNNFPQASTVQFRALHRRPESVPRVPTIGERARLGKSQTSLRWAANAWLDWQPAATQARMPPSTLLTSVKPALISTSAARAERAPARQPTTTGSPKGPPTRAGHELGGPTTSSGRAHAARHHTRADPQLAAAVFVVGRRGFARPRTPLRVVGRAICADVAASLSLREGARGSWRRRGRGAALLLLVAPPCRGGCTRLRAPAHSCGCLAVGRGCCFGTPVTEAAPATQPLTSRRIIARRGVFGTAARSADDG